MSSSHREVPGQSLKIFSCPADYTPSRFFLKYKASFVPPIYRNRLTDIQEATNTDAVQLWGWAFDRLAECVGIRKGTQDFASHTHDRREGFIPCASSKVSEVFKSSYLQVLEALADAHVIDEASLRLLCAHVCPMDLSFWRIGVSERPYWWPDAQPWKDGLRPVGGWKETTDLALKTVEGGDLLFAEGPFASTERDGLQASFFRLTPFAYRVGGGNIPKPEQVAYVLSKATWSIESKHGSAVSIFDAPLSDWTVDEQQLQRIGHLVVVPLIARIDTININCWQYWRGSNAPAFPSTYLAENGEHVIGERSWQYVEDGKVRFVGQDWLTGPINRVGKFDFEAHGQFAVVDRAWLDRLLAEKGFDLAFVQQHTYRVRASEYQEPKTSTFAEYINFSRLIA